MCIHYCYIFIVDVTIMFTPIVSIVIVIIISGLTGEARRNRRNSAVGVPAAVIQDFSGSNSSGAVQRIGIPMNMVIRNHDYGEDWRYYCNCRDY